ncbi:hypothetical protein SAMN05216215_101878 [Saccharopolyspora shandongensis]|uniref:Uncharacterized protein n=1 Tax=Saccharopolyspora shandongensis TaxID=418495 RepID=A0A1H3G8A2_9PSEU|nr:hypothetical protein [Saccharopolyspora shandongensis]SDX99270.1 hypothetical protein SAMN05216215_101878 [Saccharopolyspora shandongensis]
MTGVGVGDVVADLEGIKAGLPYGAGGELRDSMEPVIAEVADALRTSEAESTVLGALVRVKQDGSEVIDAGLVQICQVIDTAATTW